MAGIHVYNRNVENHEDDKNNFPIFRGVGVLGNPYTEIKDKKTKAMFIVKDRETALKKYGEYFDIMYGSNRDFTIMIDRIYDCYKRGEDVYLECYCHPGPCHGDIIKKKLEQRLIKEQILKIKESKF